jgi:uncharacterized protein YbaP (TraB family)
MSTRWLLAIALLALGVAIPQLCPAAGAPAAGKPHPLFLWKATGGKGTVYLLGSVHAAKADFYPLPRPIERDFRKSAVLVEEIDLARDDPARLHQQVLASGLYPAGDSLENHVSRETWLALQGYLKRTGQDPAAFARMKPWLASVIITWSAMKPDAIHARYGIDEHFAQEAKAAHKATAALESARFQLDLLSRIPAPLQDALLSSSLREAQKGAQGLEDILHAWRTGNAEAMEHLITQDEREHPRLKPLYDALLTARNRRMAEKIERYPEHLVRRGRGRPSARPAGRRRAAAGQEIQGRAGRRRVRRLTRGRRRLVRPPARPDAVRAAPSRFQGGARGHRGADSAPRSAARRGP